MKTSRDKYKELIREVYIEYKYTFREYRRETTHFSKNGKYIEWSKKEKNNYESEKYENER